MNNLLLRIIFPCFFITLYSNAYAQNSQTRNYKTATVMFYNVENLYDTIKSADIINGNLLPEDPNYQISVPEDSALASGLEIYKGELSFEKLKGKQVIRKQILTDEFYYQGTKVWNSKKYQQKISNLAKVISEAGRTETHASPAIVGLCEVENEHVLNDLCKELRKKGSVYGFVHFNSFDARGVDTGLLYDKSRFIVTGQKRLIVSLERNSGYREYTRDILWVEGLLDGEKMYFFVNHWPSRRGGEQASMPKRIKAAEVLKKAMDSILTVNPDAKILAMGDYNDDPTSPSIKKTIGTFSRKSDIKKGLYFNPAEQLYKKGSGTLAYQDIFSFFDQQIMSPAMVSNPNQGYQYYSMNVFSPLYLTTKEGQWKGYPFRSFSGDNYTGGYSDHFPVYTILIKEINP
ncbi:endonuclease [Apibacter raozihei]|uniref:endonuclease/exonuclease/phosphatase family protein n=1 Tax=Apibacter raozihei TaxID=2500547 RepID=UPI001E46957F|nr:endonuclease [Apibacter raozihei]